MKEENLKCPTPLNFVYTSNSGYLKMNVLRLIIELNPAAYCSGRNHKYTTKVLMASYRGQVDRA